MKVNERECLYILVRERVRERERERECEKETESVIEIKNVRR